MIKLSEAGVYLVNGKEIIPADSGKNLGTTPEEARKIP